MQKQNRVKNSYCTENKMMIPSVSHAEVQSDLKAPLKHTTDIS